MRILVADDDREIVELLNIYLHNEGYDVIKAYNGHQALSYIKNDVDHEIGLIILDIMMPKVDGMQVLDKLRAANYETPVLMLSAKSSDQDKIQGLTSGADDYVTKPFNPLEIIARVKSILRRQSTYQKEVAEPDVIEIGPLIIRRASHEVKTLTDKDIQLTALEFGILYLLASHPTKSLVPKKYLKPFGTKKVLCQPRRLWSMSAICGIRLKRPQKVNVSFRPYGE